LLINRIQSETFFNRNESDQSIVQSVISNDVEAQVPYNVKYFEKNSFINASSIKKLTFEDNSEFVQFRPCGFISSNIEEIIFPTKQLELADSQFINGSKIKKLIYPAKVTSAEEEFLLDLDQSVEITIELKQFTFHEHDNIIYLYIPASASNGQAESIHFEFFGMEKLETLILDFSIFSFSRR
jgi:hypothetical protein